MKRALALLIACGLLLGVTATSSFAADKVVIKMAGMKPDGEPETLGMRKFGEILKELSGGKYDVQVFPNSQLGKEDAYIASTRKQRRDNAAPPHPESFDTAMAKRGSTAAAQRAVLPCRECPMTATREASTSSSVSR